MDLEKISMTLIAHSGEARRYAFEALQKAKESDIQKSEELLKESEKEINLAHKGQTELLVREARGEQTPINILLIHAQDHLMTSMVAIDLIKEFILVYKNMRRMGYENIIDMC